MQSARFPRRTMGAGRMQLLCEPVNPWSCICFTCHIALVLVAFDGVLDIALSAATPKKALVYIHDTHTCTYKQTGVQARGTVMLALRKASCILANWEAWWKPPAMSFAAKDFMTWPKKNSMTQASVRPP